MNELIFCIHIFVELLFLAIALRIGEKALVVFVVLSAILANFFVVKQIVLFGMQVTCSDVFTVGGLLGLNVLQEIYGIETAKSAIRISLFALSLYIVMSQIHLLYVPSSLDETHAAYSVVLGNAPRIVAASLGVYYLVQRVDVWLFAFLRRFFTSLGMRLLLCLLLTQALDTVLFSFFGLYGLVASLADIILVSFVVKWAVIACSSPIVALIKRRYDRQISL